MIILWFSFILKVSILSGILVDMMICNNQRSFKIKNISGPTDLIMMVLFGDSIAIKISAGYSEHNFHPCF